MNFILYELILNLHTHTYTGNNFTVTAAENLLRFAPSLRPYTGGRYSVSLIDGAYRAQVRTLNRDGEIVSIVGIITLPKVLYSELRGYFYIWELEDMFYSSNSTSTISSSSSGSGGISISSSMELVPDMLSISVWQYLNITEILAEGKDVCRMGPYVR